ncbi:ExeM/NucH family extracellular endonuclease [Blastococcus sp. Marseille-P5729]|uniref:ExeM/NucH family extracellular endonuclease n=1 Tax=Blastococcus sp. Marseille-P5729 TaxID=2086582 RepID=UPI0018FEDCB5|nr:ExeM/NucH family extracellular endonuclease [Blastococcus sp. Marseille-P5729]
MPTSLRTAVRNFILVIATALAATLMTQLPAAAVSDGVIINELYARGGSANQPYTNKFVELHNPTGTAIDLNGMSIQYRSATGTGNASGVVALTGTIEPGGYYVIQLGSNGTTGAPLPEPDQTSGVNPSGTTGTVFLASTTTAINPATQPELVVDKLGYGGSNSPEGTAATYTGSNSTPGSLGRTTAVDTDDNATDFTFLETPTPGAANTGTTPDPDPDPEPEPDPTVVSIAEIQGAGAETPMNGQRVTTIGVVTASYPTGGFNGFYLQTPGSGGVEDSTPGASDGIFVYLGSGAEPATVGACLTVTGTAGEYYGLTQLSSPTIAPASDCAPAKAVELETLPATDAEKEQYEGMLVHPIGSYTITNNYQLSQYGQIGLAYGDQPLYQATDVVAPGPEAAAYEAANLAKYITLDDGSSWNYLTNQTAQSTPLPYLSQETPMRTGSQVTFVSPVILDYRFQWNYQPVGQVVGSDDVDIPITSENDREATVPSVGGDLQMAAFNVLNYFTDLGQDEAGCRSYDDREGNPVGARDCQVRGAYTPEAFADQQAKIVNAINSSGAEIVALMEVENSAGITYLPGQDRDKALAELVAALNAAGGNWAYAPSPVVLPPNEDVIRTAFIYNPDVVSLDGPSEILLDGAFANARYPLAQKFTVNDSTTSFVAIANHFKSKGSGEDDGTGQGLANPSREAQATALTTWANTAYADEAVFLLGDFNAYSKETPVQIIEGAGYTGVEKLFEPTSATYQFSGRLGSLDHIFANAKALELVTGAAVWDINGDESVAMQYSRRNYNITDFYTTSPFASSDHDPAIAGIRATPEPDPADPGDGDPGDDDQQPGVSQPGSNQAGTDQPGGSHPPAGGPKPGGGKKPGAPALAATGVDAAPMGLLSALLITAGAAAVAAGRRRAS